MNADSEELTIAAVSKRLGRSDRTIRRYLHEGTLTGQRVDMPAGGQKWLVDRASLEALEAVQGGHAGAADGKAVDMTAQVASLSDAVQGLVHLFQTDSREDPRLTEGDLERIAARVAELLEPAVQQLLPPARDAERLDRIEALLAERTALEQQRDAYREGQIAERRARLEAQRELARLRRPWWRRWFTRRDA